MALNSGVVQDPARLGWEPLVKIEHDHSGAQAILTVVDAAMKVYTALGPGLLESAYEGCLIYERGRRIKPGDPHRG